MSLPANDILTYTRFNVDATLAGKLTSTAFRLRSKQSGPVFYSENARDGSVRHTARVPLIHTVRFGADKANNPRVDIISLSGPRCLSAPPRSGFGSSILSGPIYRNPSLPLSNRLYTAIFDHFDTSTAKIRVFLSARDFETFHSGMWAKQVA